MKLSQFSLKNIAIRSRAAIERFPLAILACAIGTGIAIALIHVDETGRLPNILMALSLAAPIFVAIELIRATQAWHKTRTLVVNAVAIVLLIVYYFLLPDLEIAHGLFYIRHAMWTIGFVLLITFIPFALNRGKETIMAFWQYNRALVFALIVTAIWAGALQAGIAIALASIDFLFEITIDEERYLELWFVLVGIFSPLFFLNRLPVDPQKYNKDIGYPKEVRLFSQFVLVPLVSVYFLILYAYTAQILITGEWPEGQVAYMILGFSFLGVLTYLCLYPLREKVRWIHRAGDILFIAMIPQVIVLYRALMIRINEYGITENRYFVFVFGCWLLAMAVYYLGSKEKDIRVIPATIFLIAFLSSFGPWGAFQVSERSQINRLEGLLIDNQILVDGQVLAIDDDEDVSRDDVIEISEIVRYLDDTHGLDGIQTWFADDLSDLEAQDVVEDLIGIDYTYWWDHRPIREDNGYFFLTARDHPAGTVGGYENWMFVSDERGYVTIDGSQYDFDYSRVNTTFSIKQDGDELIEYSLQEFLGEILADRNGLLELIEELVVEFENDQIKGVLHLDHISGDDADDGGYELDFLEGIIFFTVK